MKLHRAAPILAIALSVAACSGNAGPDNAATVEPSVLNEDALEATENLTVTDTPLGNDTAADTSGDTLGDNALDANLTTLNDTGGNAL